MEELISVKDFEKFDDVTPNNDGTYNKEDLQQLLKDKAMYYALALEEVRSSYNAINVQEQNHKDELSKISSQHDQDLQQYKDREEEIKKEYAQKDADKEKQQEEYNKSSQLLTQLTIEARENVNKAQQKAEEIKSKAEDEAKEIINNAHKEKESILSNAQSQSSQIIEAAKKEMQSYTEEQMRKAENDAKNTRQIAQNYKEQQEQEINDLRKQSIDANEKIINEGSEKAKNLVNQAKENANSIMDEAQSQYNEISKDIKQSKRANHSLVKHMRQLINEIDRIKEHDSYKALDHIAAKTKSQIKQHEEGEKKETKQSPTQAQQEIKTQENVQSPSTPTAVSDQDLKDLPPDLQESIKNSINFSKEMLDKKED